MGYHNPNISTPNINQLAEEGIILDQSYVAPFCTPSRSALMTGMDPYHIGRQVHMDFYMFLVIIIIYNNVQRFVLKSTSLTGLTVERKLMPEYLKDLGYSTHIIGK